jgi:hypothetical protein
VGKHADEGHELGVIGGLAALSLDALSSVAYGPQAMMLILVTAGLVGLKYLGSRRSPTARPRSASRGSDMHSALRCRSESCSA